MLTEAEHSKAEKDVVVLQRRLSERIAHEEGQSYAAQLHQELKAAREALAFFNTFYPTDTVFFLQKAQKDLDIGSAQATGDLSE